MEFKDNSFLPDEGEENRDNVPGEEELTLGGAADEGYPGGTEGDGGDGAGNGGKQSFGLELFDWAKALATAVIVVVIMFTFFFRIVGVKGSSMVPTLHAGDRVLLQCIGVDPEPGDIVVLTKRAFGDESIIKRVIATEGQTVDIDFTTGQVWVDGTLMNEPYIAEPTRAQGDMTFPLTVKEGCVFVMGDNRNASTDSRVSVIGQVDERCIIGRLVVRLFPFGSIGKVN